MTYDLGCQRKRLAYVYRRYYGKFQFTSKTSISSTLIISSYGSEICLFPFGSYPMWIRGELVNGRRSRQSHEGARIASTSRRTAVHAAAATRCRYAHGSLRTMPMPTTTAAWAPTTLTCLARQLCDKPTVVWPVQPTIVYMSSVY